LIGVVLLVITQPEAAELLALGAFGGVTWLDSTVLVSVTTSVVRVVVAVVLGAAPKVTTARAFAVGVIDAGVLVKNSAGVPVVMLTAEFDV
jgi:hypothetical protein